MSNRAAIIFNKASKAIGILLAIAAVITVAGFIVDLYNTITYPGTDLRNRVVGARLMLEGIDPYFFKWQAKLSANFYDPLDIPEEVLSKLSVPPTVLTIHSLIAPLSYLQQKLIWLVVQWAAFIGTVLIFFKTSNSQAQKNLVLIVGFLFANSMFWRFHVNSGQIYIVYVFLLAIAWLCLNKTGKQKEIVSGFFAGITASLRPSFLLFFLPFVICRKLYFLLGGILGILFSVILSFSVVDLFIWKKYAITMLGMTGYIDINTYANPKLQAIASNTVYPQIIEGFDWNIRNPLENYLDNTSLYDVLNAIDIPNKRNLLAIGFILTLIVISLYIFRYSLKHINIKHLFLIGTLVCLITDFFIPVGRFSYYDIQMILPLLIIVNLAEPQKLIKSKLTAVLAIGLLLSVVGFLVVPRALFFSVFLIMLYLICTSFLIWERSPKITSD